MLACVVSKEKKQIMVSLIGSASNKFHLKLKESLLILKMKPSLNIAKESMPLMLFDHVA